MSAATVPWEAWGIDDRDASGQGKRATVATVASFVPGLALLALGIIWLPALVLGGLWCLLAGAWLWGQGRLALGAVNATPASAVEEARVVNVVQGLSADLSVVPPKVFVFAGNGAEALVCHSAGGYAIALSHGLLSTYTRTELEAVVSHCLVRIVLGRVRPAAVAAALGPLGATMGPVVGGTDDLAAVSATRYPPGLMKALSKAQPATGRLAAFYLASAGPTHRPTAERVAALADL